VRRITQAHAQLPQGAAAPLQQFVATNRSRRHPMTVADLMVSRFARAGARAIFGMPGGGSNLDVIDAARRQGLPFVLAHTETAGAIMACAQAEITGAPGVCLSTLGPGVASLVNGVAHAFLDRVPLVVLTDALPAAARRAFTHQNLPHAALLGDITRFTADLTAGGVDALLARALRHATANPPGPVHIDCTQSAMEAEVARPAAPMNVEPAAAGTPLPAEAGRLLRAARRPLAIVGLGARGAADAAAIRALSASRGVPVLTTYKAKGVVASHDPMYAGLFTLGEIERPLVEAADVLVTFGLDSVELLPRAWPWGHPTVHCARWMSAGDQLPPAVTAIGNVSSLVQEIEGSLPGATEWTPAEIAAHRTRQQDAVMDGAAGLTPGRAVTAIRDAATGVRHTTVDAGAHMFPAMALLPADAPNRILISNGLSTMGYALPAAIGAALLAPREPVLAITGDAGLLMCLAELRTAARERLRVVVVVFADEELSLIRIKQDRRGLRRDGVGIGAMSWTQAAAALGARAAAAHDEAELRRCVTEALEGEGPALIEARVDPAGYGAMLRRLRG
jgi:acetolactate synthase-1/2/3 large subunit